MSEPREPSTGGAGPSRVTSDRGSARQLAIVWSIVLGAVLVPLLVLTGANHFSAGAAQDRAKARWETHEPAAYSFDFSYCGGFCQGCTTRVTVEGGEVVSAVAAEPGGCTDYGVQDAPTVEDVFDRVAVLREDDLYVSEEIRYDPTWGFPASASFECPEGTSDCGTGLSVKNFRVAP